MAKDKSNEPETGAYRSKIIAALSKLGSNGTASPDTSNSGRLLSDFYLWSTVRKFAEKREKAAIAALDEAGLYRAAEYLSKDAGFYEAYSSPAFSLMIQVTEKIRRLDKDKLVKIFSEKLKKFKVPASSIRLWLEDSYVAEKSQQRKTIIER